MTASVTHPGTDTWRLAWVGQPRLLDGVQGRGRVDLAAHEARHGSLPPHRRGRGTPALIAALSASGLLGRGGAAFPFGLKVAAVAQRRRRPIVVVNASEGEPLSRKDAALLAHVPHVVLDGAQACAVAVRAREIVVVVHRGDDAARSSLTAALQEREQVDHPGVAVRVEEVPDRYVSGEAGAVVRFLSGGQALPTGPRPRPDERGVDGRPTLLSNAETYAHAGLIARYGPEWFAGVGAEHDPGTRLLTVIAPDGSTTVVEAPTDARAGDALAAAGATPEQVGAVLVGGYAGTWLSTETVGTISLASPRRGSGGAALGVGLLACVPPGTCVLSETARIAHWMAGESARQCGPCLNGLPAIAVGLAALAAGRGNDDTLADVARWCGLVVGRGACHHPGGVVRTVRSALDLTATDVVAHAAGHPCSAARHSGALRVPSVALGAAMDWR